MTTFRTREEIDEQLNQTIDSVDEGSTKWPGMTYEQGVDNALRWVAGDSDQPPMED